jgi:FMN phosphatase YigB (HAD superfamily)
MTPYMLEQAFHQMRQAGLEVGDPEEALATLKRLDISSESASQTLQEFLEILGADQKYFDIGNQAVYGPLPLEAPIFALEGALELLEDLALSHQLALVSIGIFEQQLFKLKKAGIDSTIFSKIVISPDRDKKPHYEAVLEELGFAPSQTLVCGDRVTRDLKPAKELGCKTVQMKWGRGLAGSSWGASSDVDFCIRTLGQLKECII